MRKLIIARAMSTRMPTLQKQFGAIDIYLFDQLLRGNLSKAMTIFDAGCGTGRNIVYLLREGYEVFGADPDPQAIVAVRSIDRARFATTLI
jgi:tellurite methyltransferase